MIEIPTQGQQSCATIDEAGMFNDAAAGIAPEPATLESHARRLPGLRARAAAEDELRSYPASGYFSVRHGPFAAVIDE